jgi:hypothetical protein
VIELHADCDSFVGRNGGDLHRIRQVWDDVSCPHIQQIAKYDTYSSVVGRSYLPLHEPPWRGARCVHI